MPRSEQNATVEQPLQTQVQAKLEIERTPAVLRIALATVLSIIGCWGLFVACAACLAYLFAVPVHFVWFLVGGTVLGFSLLYLSSRLWARWRFGVGIIAITEGGLLLSISLRPLLAADSSERAIARSFLTTAVVGFAAGLALLAREVALKRGDSR